MADFLAAYRAGGGFEGTDEYQPPGADHWLIAMGLPDACFSADSSVELGIADPPEPFPSGAQGKEAARQPRPPKSGRRSRCGSLPSPPMPAT